MAPAVVEVLSIRQCSILAPRRVAVCASAFAGSRTSSATCGSGLPTSTSLGVTAVTGRHLGRRSWLPLRFIRPVFRRAARTAQRGRIDVLETKGDYPESRGHGLGAGMSELGPVPRGLVASGGAICSAAIGASQPNRVPASDLIDRRFRSPVRLCVVEFAYVPTRWGFLHLTIRARRHQPPHRRLADGLQLAHGPIARPPESALPRLELGA